ncbi:MAG TPA: N-acetylmuramoyl-L-alanine amidase [Rhizomicrobium sp.]|nr:N-acetylmuramoyl-L-alanine amidase [Rhizomicrobium sp.]
MTLRIVSCPSPNHDPRPPGAPVDILVLHYTGMKTADEALARLTDPAAKVSAHYTIGRDGRIFAHVPEERRAWHAGVSYWAGETNVNGRSIGIEIVNPGHEFGYEPFAEPQIAALIDLARGILSRHPIPPNRVVGHSDVAPARKMDPGELFPWKSLAEFGIGLWPAPGERELREAPEIALARFGYGLPPQVDVPLEAVITAFQRHFRPSGITGRWDGECAAALAALLSPRAVA